MSTDPLLDLVNHTYDAISMMGLASRILDDGNVDDKVAGEISWMLSSCQKRLEPVVESLDDLHMKHSRPSHAKPLITVNRFIEAHRLALERFEALSNPDDTPEDVRKSADDAEAAAFNELLKFPCQTKEAKARKAEYVVEHLGRNRFSRELDIDQFETLLDSLIQ